MQACPKNEIPRRYSLGTLQRISCLSPVSPDPAGGMDGAMAVPSLYEKEYYYSHREAIWVVVQNQAEGVLCVAERLVSLTQWRTGGQSRQRTRDRAVRPLLVRRHEMDW